MDNIGNTLDFGSLFVNLAGGLALFLYGMHIMIDALKIVAGERAKQLLSRLTKNRFSAAFAGAAVTAVIQSSSVTTVLVVGFITAGIMTFSQSIGVILGANVGTTITAQIIAFKITNSALLLIAIGFFTEALAHHQRIRQLGILSLGLGLLFFGMQLMSQATAPLRDYEPFMQMMVELENPFLALALGAAFTAIVQSSSATTGIVIVMASQGLVTLETGVALTLGANVGTCVTVFVSAIGKPREAMQAATAHIVFNVVGAMLFIGFIPWLADLTRSLSPVYSNLSGLEKLAAETPRQIANAHTIFNVINLVLFLGFTNTLAKMVLRLVPSLPEVEALEVTPKYLDRYYLDQPAVALDRVQLEIGRLGEKTMAMLRDSMPTLTLGTRERINTLHEKGIEVEKLHGFIIAYLRKLSMENLVNPQPENLYQYLSIANYIENINDRLQIEMVRDSYRRLEKHLTISTDTEEKLKKIYRETFLTGQTCLQAFEENDKEKAREVIVSKDRFRGMIEHARSHLYWRLTSESQEHLAVYKLESNILENYRRIHSIFRAICKLIVDDTLEDKKDENKDDEVNNNVSKQAAEVE